MKKAIFVGAVMTLFGAVNICAMDPNQRTINNLKEQLQMMQRQMENQERQFREQITQIQATHQLQMQQLRDSLLEQFHEQLSRERESGLRQMDAAAEREKEEVRRRDQVVKEHELSRQIEEILFLYGLKPTDIISVEETERRLMSLDLLERFSSLSELYNKRILPFSKLLKSADLSKVKNYLKTIPVPREELKEFRFSPGGVYPGGDFYLCGNISEVEKAVSYGANITIKGGDNGFIRTFGIYKSQAIPERDRINAIIREERERFRKRLEPLNFPGAELKRLIEKVNGFLQRCG